MARFNVGDRVRIVKVIDNERIAPLDRDLIGRVGEIVYIDYQYADSDYGPEYEVVIGDDWYVVYADEIELVTDESPAETPSSTVSVERSTAIRVGAFRFERDSNGFIDVYVYHGSITLDDLRKVVKALEEAK